MTHLTDKELVILYVQTRQSVYFNQLYSRSYRQVYRVCRQFADEPATAEDLTHDVFLKLLDRLGQYGGEAPFMTWLRKLTSNLCLDYLERRNRIEHSINLFLYNQEVNGLPDYTETTRWEDLQRNLRTLSNRDQQLLIDKYLTQSSIQDIAMQYQLTPSAVKMRIKRAKERLRILL